MPNIFESLKTGKSSLITNRTGKANTGRNVSNIHTEGYSRQRALQETKYTDHLQPGQIGRGVRLKNILRIYKQFIENTLRKERTGAAEWQTVYDSNTLVGMTLFKPSESGLDNKTSLFFNAWQDLYGHPEDYGLKTLVRTAGNDFAEAYNKLMLGFKNLRGKTDAKVTSTVKGINGILDDVAKLNKRILAAEVSGQDTDYLKDKRDNLITELAKKIDITVTKQPDGLQVFFGDRLLVEGYVTNHLDTQENILNDGYSDVTFGGGMINFNNIPESRKGELGAVIKFRDNMVTAYQDKTTEYAVTLAHNVNDEHFDGYSYNGSVTGIDFFTVNDTVGLTAYADRYVISSRTGVIRIDAMTDIESGSHHLAVTGSLNVPTAGERSDGLSPSFTASLDGGPAIAIAPNSSVLFTGGANSGFTAGGTMRIIFGPTLTAANETITAYTQNASLGITDDILNDVNSIASASRLNLPGDNSNAHDIVNMQFNTLMNNNTQTFSQFYNGFTTQVNADTENAFRWMNNQETIVKQLTEQRKVISGVNLDEELTFMLKYQRGFESASRYVTTIDGMIDVIINRMGY